MTRDVPTPPLPPSQRLIRQCQNAQVSRVARVPHGMDVLKAERRQSIHATIIDFGAGGPERGFDAIPKSEPIQRTTRAFVAKYFAEANT